MSDLNINELKEGLKRQKPSPLEQVKQDAKYNYLKRLKEQQEKAAYREAQEKGSDAIEKFFEEQKLAVKKPSKKGK